ncbi:hypothetical protein U1Q18_029110, partial [Sarracenia purpurea var. burkii]
MGAHFNIANVDSEPEKGFEERILPIGLATDGNYLEDRELLAEGNYSLLKAI